MDPKEFRILMETQEVTNIAYSGEDWRKLVLTGWLLNCITCEQVEYLDEITGTWKWYEKRVPKYDPSKALFELVDTAHFMAAVMLKFWTPEKLEAIYYGELDGYGNENMSSFPNFLLDQTQDFHAHLDKELTLFKMAIHNESLRAVRHFIQYVSASAALLGYDAVDFFKAYKLKNERNMGRVAAGVMHGVDVKSGEKDLVL